MDDEGQNPTYPLRRFAAWPVAYRIPFRIQTKPTDGHEDLAIIRPDRNPIPRAVFAILEIEVRLLDSRYCHSIGSRRPFLGGPHRGSGLQLTKKNPREIRVKGREITATKI